jgi:hypothetical protein
VEAMDVTAIKTLVEQGRYEVDSQLVADAIICRLLGRSTFAPPSERGAGTLKARARSRQAPRRRRGS